MARIDSAVLPMSPGATFALTRIVADVKMNPRSGGTSDEALTGRYSGIVRVTCPVEHGS